MVLLPDGRAKIRDEGYAEGWAEGFEKGFVKGFAKGWADVAPEMARIRSAWLSWNARRLDHENRGEPFDEPPPMPIDGHRNGKNDSGSQ